MAIEKEGVFEQVQLVCEPKLEIGKQQQLK